MVSIDLQLFLIFNCCRFFRAINIVSFSSMLVFEAKLPQPAIHSWWSNMQQLILMQKSFSVWRHFYSAHLSPLPCLGMSLSCRYSTIISKDNSDDFFLAYCWSCVHTSLFCAENGGKLCSAMHSTVTFFLWNCWYWLQTTHEEFVSTIQSLFVCSTDSEYISSQCFLWHLFMGSFGGHTTTVGIFD